MTTEHEDLDQPAPPSRSERERMTALGFAFDGRKGDEDTSETLARASSILAFLRGDRS